MGAIGGQHKHGNTKQAGACKHKTQSLSTHTSNTYTKHIPNIPQAYTEHIPSTCTQKETERQGNMKKGRDTDTKQTGLTSRQSCRRVSFLKNSKQYSSAANKSFKSSHFKTKLSPQFSNSRCAKQKIEDMNRMIFSIFVKTCMMLTIYYIKMPSIC